MAPAGLWFRFGHWYLVAWDLEREACARSGSTGCRVRSSDWARGARRCPKGSTSEAALPDDPVADGEADDQVVTRIRVDAMEGPRVAEEVGRERVERQDEDGSVVLRLSVVGFSAIRAWVLGLLDHAEILEPAEFRSELRAWLGAMVDEEGATPMTAAAPVSAERASAGRWAEPAGSGRGVPGRETSERLRRLLAVVGWLAHVGEAPIADVAQRFGMDETELVHELELAACCGVPPYTPDALMEIEVSETRYGPFCRPSSPDPVGSLRPKGSPWPPRPG